MLGSPPSWLKYNDIVPSFIALFSILHFFQIERAIARLPALSFLIDLFLVSMEGFSRTLSITTSGVDLVLNHPDPSMQRSLVAMLIAGMTAGCGGGIFADTLQLTETTWSMRTPSIFQKMTSDAQLSFFTSFLYVFSTRSFRLDLILPSELAKMIDAVVFKLVPQLSHQDAKAICGWVNFVFFTRNFLQPEQIRSAQAKKEEEKEKKEK